MVDLSSCMFAAIHRLDVVSSSGGGWVVRCPCKSFHKNGDTRPSARVWVEGDSLRFWCGKGCKWADAVRCSGTRKADWFMSDSQFKPEPRKAIAHYNYYDQFGNISYQVVRTEPKGFWQRRPGPDGTWINNMEGVRIVPYMWQELRKRPLQPVCVVEGEGKADLLHELGFVAICSPMGAGKWPQEFGGYLAERDVVVFADNDAPGHLHASQVAGSACISGANSIRIVRCTPGIYEIPDGGDIKDWLLSKAVHKIKIKDREVMRSNLIWLVKNFRRFTWQSKDSNIEGPVTQIQMQPNSRKKT